MTKGRTKKIVVLGVCTDHHAVYSEILKDHKVVFAISHEDALHAGRTADVVAVNIDKHNGFLNTMFDRLFEGKVVAIATSRKLMNKLVELPNGGKVSPVCQRTAPEEIMRLLAV
ncbi:MAG: hypothetical protein UW27_C0010G0041 [Parcubacteria group bacterium GW2011_GWA1_44_13]|uniref:RCK N-terminal domain-containing protein n=1 Tax=Candidatus Nomurabacteria bacterium GW2011_GWB1_44_12 TaxID=1618748 RepID=A0A837IC31_9BACT|nr:MAG: hypothetical protein UW17_C0023G0002 [Candidatus Nomurabacteria bacterium GW2011_GWD1_44_10]KKT36955.1 MAG: hypothetical protein UW25_C0004G0283 [Candidatus Nomurabacteria bacterium GW2011_GWB1_44_12]KKT37761.1 MAG: hypothetical protein UW27_C0010G0041 [Parcubacteria group bacterium GW2011_GWA1_44_13]HBB44311.1 hypothetical protein [Candidatus Yonathbacteria bacterium]